LHRDGASEETLTEAQKAELDRRLEDLERNPDAGESWKYSGRVFTSA